MAIALTQVLAQKDFFFWDFDGSFCNTEPMHFRAYADVFRRFGVELEELNYYRDFTHHGEGAAKVIAQHKLSVSLSEVLEEKKNIYQKRMLQDPIEDFANSRDVFAWMKSRGQVVIASNSPADEISQILRRFDLQHVPNFIVGKEAHLRKKPFPDIFLEAFSRAGSPNSSRVLVLEDSERGLQAAAAAGFDAILMSTLCNRHLHFSAPHLAELTHGQLLQELKNVDGQLGS
jgi:beta-phosphoglucomutase-like phosphatase (HAD superfamily)